MNTSIEDSQVKREKKRHNKIGRRSRDASRQDPHSVVNDSYIERISQLQRSSLRNKGSKLHIRLFNARVLHQEMFVSPKSLCVVTCVERMCVSLEKEMNGESCPEWSFPCGGNGQDGPPEGSGWCTHAGCLQL